MHRESVALIKKSRKLMFDSVHLTLHAVVVAAKG